MKMKKRVIAFVDGSHCPYAKRIGAAAIIIVGDKELSYFRSKKHTEYCNKGCLRAELEAAKLAVQIAIGLGATAVTLYYDFEGVKNCADALPKGKNGKIPWIKQYYDFMNDAKKHIGIRFRHVKGHSGDRHNDAVHRLAKSAAKAA
jgi:ribonuclease HI